MHEYDLQSGKKLSVGYASFWGAQKIKNRILKAAKGNPELEKFFGQKDVGQKDIFELFPVLFQAFVDVDTDEQLHDHIQQELKKSSNIDLQPIDQDYWRKPENWQDYYEVLYYFLWVNLAPFFKSLLSLLQQATPSAETYPQQ